MLPHAYQKNCQAGIVALSLGNHAFGSIKGGLQEMVALTLEGYFGGNEVHGLKKI